MGKRDIQLGKRIIIAIIVAVFVLSFMTFLLTISVFGLNSGKFIQYIIRWSLTGVLCYFLYQGYGWARWLMGALFGVTGVFGVITGIRMLGTNLGGLFPLIMSLIYLLSVGLLFLLPHVKMFLESQNSRSIVYDRFQ